MAILVDKSSSIVVQGITGREASMVCRHTLAYGTAIEAGISPGKGGQDVHGIPIYDTLAEACKEHELNTTMIYVPPAFVNDAVQEAIANNIRLVWIATENVPRHDALHFLNLARESGVTIVGPNSVGIISPDERIKIGPIGGDNVARCFVPGEVGVISRSGGMTAEVAWMVKQAGFGVSTAVSVGGDALIGTTPRQLLELFEADPHTRAVVTFSEPGTTFEEDIAALLESGGFRKPLICFVAGLFTESLPEGTVFGHAAAMIVGGKGKPSDKINRLREAGALVAEDFGEIVSLLQVALKE